MKEKISKVNLIGKEVKMMKKTFLILVLMLMLGVGTAYALNSASTAFLPGVINTLSDDDGEVLVNNVGGTSASPLTGVVSQTVDVGDYLVGVIGINTFPTSGVDPATVNQLTGIFALQVSSVSALSATDLNFINFCAVNPAACNPGGVPTGALKTFTFVPVVAGFNVAVSLAFPSLFGDLAIAGFTDIGGGALPASTVAIVFEGPPNDFLRSTPGDVNGNTILNEIADASLAATNGTERLVIGAIGGNQWISNYGPVWIGDALVEAALSGTLVAQVGSFTAGLTILSQNFPGFFLGPPVSIQNGAFSGDVSSLTDVPWNITSNADITFNVRSVPEPGTLSLLGTGLFGLWFLGRRLRKP
jgi:hypothetical protein